MNIGNISRLCQLSGQWELMEETAYASHQDTCSAVVWACHGHNPATIHISGKNSPYIRWCVVGMQSKAKYGLYRGGASMISQRETHRELVLQSMHFTQYLLKEREGEGGGGVHTC